MKKSFLITLIVLCVSLFVTVTAVYAEDGGAGGSDDPVTYTSVEEAGSALLEGIKRHDESIIIRHNIEGDNVVEQIFNEATKESKHWHVNYQLR